MVEQLPVKELVARSNRASGAELKDLGTKVNKN